MLTLYPERVNHSLQEKRTILIIRKGVDVDIDVLLCWNRIGLDFTPDRQRKPSAELSPYTSGTREVNTCVPDGS